MAIDLVENEIHRFLSSKDPEVISIRGRWGVGKTFAWNCFVKHASELRQIALPRYSYVSLFGITSLDDLKFSIFENTVLSEKTTEPDLASLKTNIMGIAESLGRKGVSVGQQVPWVKNNIGGLGPMWFSAVRDTVVCVDDFERRSERLAVRDILGLVSSLKEHKRCKVALILNDEALDDDKAEFNKYLEKVVDASLTFAPTPAESVAIALTSGTETAKLIREGCLALGISNIRVVKKIERAALQLEPILKQYDGAVFRQAIQSLTLLGWSHFEPNLAPPLEHLEKRDFFGIKDNKQITQKEAAWNALLDAYRWQGMDTLDHVLRDGLRDGFFDRVLVSKCGFDLHTQYTNAKAKFSWQESWKMFHESFQHNEEQVLKAISESFFSTIEYRTPVDLNGMVWLLKNLGRTAEAQKTIESYFETQDSKPPLDLDSFPFRDRIDDPDVIQALRIRFASNKEERSPIETLMRMANTRGWNDEDISLLSALPVDEYYKLFTTNNDTTLLEILDACLQFDRIGNASGPSKEISKRAKGALVRIGQESALNALRVKKYGVDVAPQPGPAGAS